MKYIIKNCPAIEDIVNYEINKDGDIIQTGIDTPDYCIKSKKQCKDITDCVMKRIVEFVKWRDEESVCNSCGLGIPHRKEEFQRILNMLEIEEAENDTLHITISKLKADLSQAETSLYACKAENEKLKNRNIELEAYFKVNEDFQKAWQELNSIHNELQKVYQNEHCDNLKYKQALEDIREILCYGRTFYDGYFDSDKLSRTDEAIKRVNEVLESEESN